MSWPEARPLEDLEAIESLELSVFVAGPGQGEGIAVAMPGSGWLLVDGCRTRGAFPLFELHTRYRRHRNDGVELLVLTHPHEDHAAGVARCIAELQPTTLGLVGVPGRSGLQAARDALTRGLDTRVTSDVLRRSAVRTALEAMERHEHQQPGSLVNLHDGVVLPLRNSSVRATVRAPDRRLLEEALTSGSISRETANAWSAVIELEFGEARVVLGSDLPTGCQSGWDKVLSSAPQLGRHHALKLPHHGSPGAYHRKLHTGSPERRCWWVTPYNASRLPPLDDLRGLPQLLRREPALLLTALPAARRLQRPLAHPGIVRLDQLEERKLPAHPRVTLLQMAVAIAAPGEPGPLDAVWAVSFDDSGRITGRWRGQVALELHRATATVGRRIRQRHAGRG